MELEILYRDEGVVAVNKPSGLLVHPSSIAADRITCLSLLRDRLGQRVYPLHRLDRGTSGVLLMALEGDTARLMSAAFLERRVEKTYLAVTRGRMPPQGTFDRPMRRGEDTTKGEKEPAVTHYRTLDYATLPWPVGKYPEARYSLTAAFPVTGRWHQIRRHFSNGNYPIVGDTVHGDGVHNRLFRERFGIRRLLLHALRLEFRSPATDRPVTVVASLPDDLRELFVRLEWRSSIEDLRLAIDGE